MAYVLDVNSSDMNAVGETMLDALCDARIFWIKPTDDGRFELRDNCDQSFAAYVTAEQLIALSDELRAMTERSDSSLPKKGAAI